MMRKTSDGDVEKQWANARTLRKASRDHHPFGYLSISDNSLLPICKVVAEPSNVSVLHQTD